MSFISISIRRSHIDTHSIRHRDKVKMVCFFMAMENDRLATVDMCRTLYSFSVLLLPRLKTMALDYVKGAKHYIPFDGHVHSCPCMA